MSRRVIMAVGIGLVMFVSAVGASSAVGDGLPVPFDGSETSGVPSLEGGLRYSAIAIGGQTAILKIAQGTGDILRSTDLDGTWAVPLVAYDASPSGLSADGRVLTVIEPRRRFPRSSTTLATLDANTLEQQKRIALDGDFSFDAISPDGGTIYLIEYTDGRDPTAYEVRAYDVERGRLLPEPIVDPNEDEDMAGFPQTRAVSPDGRWAYTLYAVAGKEHPPFIHALDTEGQSAVCIDLDVLADYRRIDTLSLSPSPDGSSLAITRAGDPIASVDLDTFDVAEAAPETTAAVTDGDDDAGAPWALIGAAAALVGAALGLFAARRRRGGPVSKERLDPVG
jgi:hypothetical protein